MVRDSPGDQVSHQIRHTSLALFDRVEISLIETAGSLQFFKKVGQQGLGFNLNQGFYFQPVSNIPQIISKPLELGAKGRMAFFRDRLLESGRMDQNQPGINQEISDQSEFTVIGVIFGA